MHNLYTLISSLKGHKGRTKMNVDSSCFRNNIHTSVRDFKCVEVLIPICAYTWDVESYICSLNKHSVLSKFGNIKRLSGTISFSFDLSIVDN